jgi:uncharacterized protein with HEPN domain
MNRDKVLLEAILREIKILPEFLTDSSLEDFLKSEIKQRAVCMTLLNIGELIKNISEQTKLNNLDIPWKDVARLRDLTAHQYQSLNMKRVFITASKFVPGLKEKIKRILSEL